MSKSKTISARVPLDIAEMVENTCKQRGLNKSQLIGELITQAPSKQNFKGGGAVQTSSIPEEVKSLLAGAGGLGVGMLVHNVLDEHLPVDRFKSEDSRQDIILLCSIAVGMGALLGISSLLKKA